MYNNDHLICAGAWDDYYRSGIFANRWPADVAVRVLGRLVRNRRELLVNGFADIGCGLGRHLWLAHELGFRELVGIEVSQVALEHAQKRWGDKLDVEWSLMPECTPEFKAETIMCWGVLDHMYRATGAELLCNIREKMGSSGCLITAVKGKGHAEFREVDQVEQDVLPDVSDAQEPGIPQRFFSSNDMSQMLEAAGFEILEHVVSNLHFTHLGKVFEMHIHVSQPS